jgi:hypothetical protein
VLGLPPAFNLSHDQTLQLRKDFKVPSHLIHAQLCTNNYSLTS